MVEGYSDKGIPILTLQKKLGALDYCMKQKSYEDAAGHMCDLLELCRKNIITDSGMMYANLEYMVRKYGEHPTPIKDVK